MQDDDNLLPDSEQPFAEPLCLDFPDVDLALVGQELPQEPDQPLPKEPKITHIQIPQEDRLDSAFATELGRILSSRDIYSLHSQAVRLGIDDDQLNVFRPITAEELCTLIEDFCVPYRIRRDSRGKEFRVLRSLEVNTARKILASPQFLRQLREVRRLNCVSLPIIRPGGEMELLPGGYDPQSRVFTLGKPISYEQMSVTRASAFFRSILEEFPFYEPDRGRAVSVVIAQILTLFCAHLFPAGTLRPGFLFAANDVGSGKTLLAKLALIPILGRAPIGTYPNDEAEMRKKITTAIMAGRPEIFLDNTKGHISSPSLEALITSGNWTDRILGGNKLFEAQHNLVVILTANDAQVSPDLMRRLFPIELFNPFADHRDRKISSWLDGDIIRDRYRGQILSAAWTLVRHWDSNRRPDPLNWHHDFRSWTQIICSIIESAGLATPCSKALLKRSGDRDGADMRRLIQLMSQQIDYTLEDLGTICENHEIFERFSTLKEGKSPSAYRSAFGKFLNGYNQRMFTEGTTFQIVGTPKNRKYRIISSAER